MEFLHCETYGPSKGPVEEESRFVGLEVTVLTMLTVSWRQTNKRTTIRTARRTAKRLKRSPVSQRLAVSKRERERGKTDSVR